MKSKTILLSGATGFLGSHLAQQLAECNFRIVALIRSSSDRSRLHEFDSSNLILVDIDLPDYEERIKAYEPNVLIHSGWGGVSAHGRDDWSVQTDNIIFTVDLLSIASRIGINKVIAFGSQAEYGIFSGRISEEAPSKPVSAYGAAKLATLNILEAFCRTHSMDWYWLRLFSVYGTRESSNWLLPSIVNNISTKGFMDLTGCEQRYDYLHTTDLGRAVVKVIEANSPSGIFNLGSNSSIRLRDLIENIRDLINPQATLNFGTLPYRQNQVMHMEGDSGKFYNQFEFSSRENFTNALKQISHYYLNKFKN